MTTTIGSLDINAFNDLYSDSNQYFWFESDSSATYGAGAHVTLVPDATFINNPTGQNILMNTNGFSVRNGLLPMMTLDNDSLDFNVVDTTEGTYATTASFSSTGAQIGVSNVTATVIINNESFLLFDSDGDELIHFGGLATGSDYTDTFTYSDVSYFTLSHVPKGGVLVVKINGTPTTSYTRNDMSVYITAPLTVGDIITMQYQLSYPVDYYSLGSREGSEGQHSFVVGYRNTASGFCACAEGSSNKAEGYVAHAEGEGAEAGGNYSHAQNHSTIANFDSQTAIGRYNDNQSGNAFEIGNGTIHTRSNALTVDWNGNVKASGDITDGSGNAFVSFETGTATAGSVTWKYRKWANGELEMWGRGLTTLNINTAVGNIYTTAGEYDIAVPSFVDSVDFVTGELSGGGWVDVTGFNVPPKIRLYAPTAYTSTNRYLRYYLKGTWS